MSETPQLLLNHHLKKLRLPTFLSEYDKLARQCATENKDHVQYLLRLSELELIERERRMIERRIKAAKFPATKSLDSFDFKAIPSLSKPLVMELARCEYVDRQENVIALGPSGTGKTTLLRLITRQLIPEHGDIYVDGTDISTLTLTELYELRQRFGMLFQNGALLTDLTVFENVAFPLREHTKLSNRLIRHIVLTKLHAVGLRGAADLLPAELSLSLIHI